MAERAQPALQRHALALVICASAALLAGCASGPRGAATGRDGAEANPPGNLDRVPDAEPRVEPIRAAGGTSKPYVVLGQSYVPIADDRPFRERGLASWYGRKFHSQSTASGEPYDMYAMTAAHKTLPLPSYVRVRNPANGREAIVRVNDRGPFHEGRVIDLSYTAALKLDLLRGVAPVEIERITNEDIRTGAWRRPGETALAQAAPTTALPPTGVPVPIAMTAPVVDQPRSTVTDLAPLAPMPPPAPVASSLSPPRSPSPQPQPVDTATPSAGFWVQLGAFSQRDGAASFQEKVARQMPSLATTLAVFSESGMHRLQAGPYASRDAALMLGEQVRNGLGLAPIVVERR
ncbi:septal ring lytic transglycosylase RlpA family protein [Variovorax sp. RT4R15]|uniref:septal ring lytic transglycosylase RlpA family protein n=1 Tax=Variovorax sp. RT4R15 TaxID=3443737 RepID=UPI003F4654E0